MLVKQINMQDEYYETCDLVLAASLMCHNFQVEDIKNRLDSKTGRKKSYFLFKKSQKLQFTVDEFNRADLLVRAKQYRNNVKDLKIRMSEQI